MNALFADTFYFPALVSEADAAHQAALEYSNRATSQLVTTSWVLTEVADGLANPRWRPAFLLLLEDLRNDPQTTVVPPSQELFDEGVLLYARRKDKEWSLTDCISFVVMEQMQLHDALTGDKHFDQAGFRALLK